MKPILVANIHELRGQAFLCACLYDGNYVIAQIIAPANEKPLAEKMRDIVWSNCDDLPAFEVHTSTEEIYIACLSESDINAHFKAQEDTKETLRDFEDARTQTALIDIYQLKDPNETEQQKQLPKWRTVLIGCLRKLIEKLEGEMKDGMETIRGI
ncbi:hypothetical protein [Bacillus cereus]|uniref:hypothetical protein n=1 Tax=Bacillus cereus TaxID=1396 RepID=UPI000937B015|nr:hypothetical protein [Bacillus cereus]OKA23407.1 hypothetical protein BJR05_23555 [Bacillus cereus]